MAWIVYALSPESRWPVRLFVGLLAVTLLIDVLRLRSEPLNRLFFRAFAVLASPREAQRPASFAWYVLGVLLVLWFAPRALVVPSTLVLALADPAASVVGRLWGKRALGKGTWEGASAFFVTAGAVLIPFAGALVALPTAGLVAAMEVLPTGLDDNLVIPVSTAAFLWVLTGLV